MGQGRRLVSRDEHSKVSVAFDAIHEYPAMATGPMSRIAITAELPDCPTIAVGAEALDANWHGGEMPTLACFAQELDRFHRPGRHSDAFRFKLTYLTPVQFTRRRPVQVRQG